MPDPEAIKKAKSHALRYLSYRDRSKLEITQYLEKKEHPHPVIEKALDALVKLNYVNDQRFALEWGRYKINKQKLGKKSVVCRIVKQRN